MFDIIVGTRPNFIKAAPLIREFNKNKDSNYRLIHTGQHYSSNMSEEIFRDLELPKPSVYLQSSGTNRADVFADIVSKYQRLISETMRPSAVIVFGDVTSTVATAMTANMLELPIYHIEAGLRSFDRTMPEEINRIITDQISDRHYVSEPSGLVNLDREHVSSDRILHVGNIMIDSLVFNQPKITGIPRKQQEEFVLVTLHRPSNVDSHDKLLSILKELNKLSDDIDILFPVHPRTNNVISDLGEKIKLSPNIYLLEAQRYLNFMALLRDASYVITDSGGIQEETSFMNKPCYTLRDNTERPITIDEGTNQLITVRDIENTYVSFSETSWPADTHIPLWDGKTAERIYTDLLS
ncbi:MAG: UDP-N-acetylglucosamine 2-epimerase (non-hydrolyzing) [Balneolaceae bacterium]|nr:UDP-N-acetylglucosamine 2-epimerase (non-hydrolyzing) [Balneolaceae bacterium]